MEEEEKFRKKYERKKELERYKEYEKARKAEEYSEIIRKNGRDIMYQNSLNKRDKDIYIDAAQKVAKEQYWERNKGNESILSGITMMFIICEVLGFMLYFYMYDKDSISGVNYVFIPVLVIPIIFAMIYKLCEK